MTGRPKIEEQYKRGTDVINFVVYASTTGYGDDEVLQHKMFGTTETAHVTLHPDGSVNFRVKLNRAALEAAIRNGLKGYSPAPSRNVMKFLSKVRPGV